MIQGQIPLLSVKKVVWQMDRQIYIVDTGLQAPFFIKHLPKISTHHK